MNEPLNSFSVVIEIPVAWGEMDAMQHVNNIVYFRYIESARMAYFERIGFLEHQRITGIGPILAWTSCRFRRALTYPDKVRVGTRVTKVESDRFTMHTRIVSDAMSDVAAESEGIVVSFDYRNQTKTPLPLQIRERIEGLEPKFGNWNTADASREIVPPGT